VLCIMISKEKLPQLDAEGAQVRINGSVVILKKVGDTLSQFKMESRGLCSIYAERRGESSRARRQRAGRRKQC